MTRPDLSLFAGRRARELRTRLTVSEARLWAAIKGKENGARFRRQVPIGPWIADFAAFTPRIVIEVDDSSHQWRDEDARTAYLRARGFSIIRFSNREIAQRLDDVVGAITETVTRLRSR